ncbi:MAG: histidine kinase [Rubrivivax sp.]|nr:MAG: histidine kinase [Rubrivivax sp.]
MWLTSAVVAWAGTGPAPITLRTAEALLQPDGLPATNAHLSLEHRWDQAFPGLGGRVTYRLSLPALGATSEPMALLFSRLGNQAVVRVNGSVIQRLGLLGDPRFDAAKTCYLVIVPASLLRVNQANELLIDVTVQRQRGGGLAPVLYGPMAEVEPLYAQQRHLRHSSSLAYAVSLALMGGLAAGLWWRQRDALYGCFSLAAFCGVARNLDRVWPDVPLPWPWWGAIVAVCYALHLALIVRFALLALNRDTGWMRRFAQTTTWLATGLAGLSFLLRSPDCMGGVALIAGVHDLLLVRLGLMSGSRYTLVPHAMFFFVLALGGVVVERYSSLVRRYHGLNASLADQVAERERQLGQAFEALREQREQQAVLNERQRMMREIHDGVGSQLVGLLNMVNQPDASPQVLETHVREALDEMRMAVDSLQPMEGDLTTLLATLRYRLQPRLTAAGIGIVWDVAPLPPLPQLSPQAVLDVQRLLLEAFTNVLKHARASQVAVHARWLDGDEPSVQIVLEDNGVGLPSELVGPAKAAPPSRGLLNMQARAQAIGASLGIERALPHGTRVTLTWPLPAASAVQAS